MYTVYLIDGVRVPKRTWEARQQFGEYVGALFTTHALVPKHAHVQLVRVRNVRYRA